MLTENYALKSWRAAAFTIVLFCTGIAQGQEAKPNTPAATTGSIEAETSPVTEAIGKKTYFRYQWQKVHINGSGNYFMVCPQGVFKMVRCWADGSMRSDNFTFLQEDLAKAEKVSVDILSTNENAEGDLEVLYTATKSGSPAFVRPDIQPDDLINRIQGDDGLNKSAKKILSSRIPADDRLLSAASAASEAEKSKEPKLSSKIYYKWQWQQVQLDKNGSYFFVCPDGVFKFMLCYPDGYKNHDEYTFLEEDLMKIAQHPVDVISTTKTPRGDLNVTYRPKTDPSAKYVRPALNRSTVIDLISGTDGLNKSAKLAEHEYRNATQSGDGESSGHDVSGFGIVLIILLTAISTIWGFEFLRGGIPSSSTTRIEDLLDRTSSGPRVEERPIEVQPTITPDRETVERNIQRADQEIEQTKRKVYID